MHCSVKLFVHAALSLALLPTSYSLVFESEEKSINFDDRSVVTGPNASNEVGIHGGLKWNGFTIDKPRARIGGEEYTGVETKSEPNDAAGQIDLFGGLPMVTSCYENSNVAFFDMEKFWWGCTTTDEETEQQYPGWCTLEIYGYAHDVKEPVAKAVSFFFPKDNPATMPMVETLLPSTFKAIARVEFNIIATRPILYLDDVSYKLYNVTDMSNGLSEVVHAHQTSLSEFHLQLERGANSL